MKKILLVLSLLLIGLFSQAQNGLEKIIVEKYYITSAADSIWYADNIGVNTGTVLPVGSTTYRFYVDMRPGYNFQMAYGSIIHPLKLITTTSFFNDEDYGSINPSFTYNNARKGTTMIDSWVSINGAITGGSTNKKVGVLKTADTDGAVTNSNGILLNNNPDAGFPLNVRDGLMPGTIPTITMLGLEPMLTDIFGAANAAGNNFVITNGAWSVLGGAQGLDTSNRVLIAQITTDGVFNYELNIQIGTPTGDIEVYVANNPQLPNINGVYEKTIPSLIGTLGVQTPTIYAVSGGGNICPNGYAIVNLSGSQTNYNYQLLKDGLAYGASVVGTGNPLTWNVTDAGNYTVEISTPITAMTGSAIVTNTPTSTVEITESACDTYTWALNGQTYTISGDYTYVDGCISNILHLTITPSSTVEFTEAACDTYTWALNGQTYTMSGDYTYVDECVTNILHLTITPSSTVEFTEAACDTYTWALNGQTYTMSGDYTYVDGCVTNILHLTITPSSTVEFTEAACDTYTWALNGQTYTMSGDYTYVDECVTNILHLTITPSSTVEFTEAACDTYTWALNGQTYTMSGDYTYVDGCVTNILHLTITPSSTVEFTEAACDTYTWALNGQTYTMSGDYTYVDGCVTNILHLTITPSSTVEFTEAACDTYTWTLNGQTYTVSGDYTYVDGCVTNILHLTITPSSTVEVTEAACDTYTWALNGQTYTVSGDYTYVDGCVTNILHLTILPTTTVDVYETACDSYTWPLSGLTYTVSGDYTYSVGAKSPMCVTSILHLTILPSSTIEVTESACDTYTWALNGQTYTISGDYTYVDGCVTNILHLTITPSSTVEVTESACDTYTWALNGQTYTISGDYTYVVGCVTNILHLTITPNSTVEVTAAVCDTYTWALNGQTYTVSGDYTYVDGCVTNILHLTIIPSSTVEVTESACDTYTWTLNGQTYTISGDYTYVVGCVTNILHLTITPSSTVEVTESACDTYTWTLNGQTYTISGDYTYVVGCVTNILHLTITPSSIVEFTESACDTYTWALNGQTYTVSGDYTYVDGCVTNILHLTITPSTIIEFWETACDFFIVPVLNIPLTISGDYPFYDGCTTYILHLTINTSVVPTFAQLGSYCKDASPDPLPTTSIEGITGTWNPAVISTSTLGTFTYTFTPDTGQCATVTTMDITITTLTVPVFPLVYGPFNIGDVPNPLPLTSNNGITGTWNPAVINTSALGSYVYTFTPDAGQCAATITRTIAIITPVPTFTFTQDIGTTLQVSIPQVASAAFYYLQYSTSPTGPWTVKPSYGSVVKVSNLTPATQYYWKAEAYNAAGYKIATVAQTAYTTLDVSFNVTQDIGTTCLLDWTDYSTWASHYTIQVKQGALGVWTTPTTSSINEKKISSLTTGATYYARIAVYKGGVLWGYSSGMATFTTNPVTFVPTNITNNSLTLSWDNFDNDLSTWTNHSVLYYRPQSSTGPWSYQSIYSNATTYNLTGLLATTYNCYVIPYQASIVWGPSDIGTFTVGTKQSAGNTNVSVYPNPFVNEVHVALFAETETDVNWNIYDMTGKLVLSGSESVSGYSTLDIDGANLPTGVYTLNAVMNDKVENVRIIKN